VSSQGRARERRRQAVVELLSPSLGAIAAAAGLGAAAGLRTATPLAVLQLRGRLLPWPWGWFIVAGAASELIVDKLPMAGNRTAPVGLLARTASAAWAGATVAGPIGAGVAGVAALAAAFIGMHTRGFLVRRTGLPDGVFATAEDLVTVALATASTSIPDRW